MPVGDFSTKKLSNLERSNEASLLLSKALVVNDLLYEVFVQGKDGILAEGTLTEYFRYFI